MQPIFMDLENICALEVSGKDARPFLNGLLTNDIQSLKVGEKCYALICSSKGKILADLFCYCIEENHFRLLLSKELRQKVLDLFQKYIVIQEVTVLDFFGQWNELEILKSQMSAKDREIMRIESMVPKYGVDMDENTLPQEAGLYHALNFQKGCYIGQETIARLEHVGHVNRKLCLLKAKKPMEPKETIFSLEGEAVGSVTSSCYSQKYQGYIALGYVRLIFAEIGKIVKIKEQEGEVLKINCRS